LKKWVKYVWIVFAILAILFLIYQITTFDEELLENPEVQENLAGLDIAVYKILEICTETDNLLDLEACKNESLPRILETCEDSISGTISACSDPRINEVMNNIDQRLDVARERVEGLN
jgi:uncharacterized protein YneF (UPF0154 family)